MVQGSRDVTSVLRLATLPGAVETKGVDDAALWITKTVNVVL